MGKRHMPIMQKKNVASCQKVKTAPSIGDGIALLSITDDVKFLHNYLLLTTLLKREKFSR